MPQKLIFLIPISLQLNIIKLTGSNNQVAKLYKRNICGKDTISLYLCNVRRLHATLGLHVRLQKRVVRSALEANSILPSPSIPNKKLCKSQKSQISNTCRPYFFGYVSANFPHISPALSFPSFGQFLQALILHRLNSIKKH